MAHAMVTCQSMPKIEAVHPSWLTETSTPPTLECLSHHMNVISKKGICLEVTELPHSCAFFLNAHAHLKPAFRKTLFCQCMVYPPSKPAFSSHITGSLVLWIVVM